MTDSAELKRRIRAGIRAARRELSEDQRADARAGLTARLKELVVERDARSLSCFLPTLSEPDTRPFLEWTERRGIDILLPSSREDGLLDWIRPSGEGTARGAHGIDEPLGEILGPEASNDLDLLLIPAAAIDLRGNRLGWGRGYFDRSLARLRRSIPVFAVIYDWELLERVPIEPHDAPITGVVTPDRIVTFSAQAGVQG